MTLAHIAVGQPWPQSPPGGWIDGASLLDWHRNNNPCLLIAISSPTAEEVEAARRGRIDLGVVGGRSVRPGPDAGALLLWRIRGLGDGDAPFDAQLLPAEHQPDLSPLTAGQRYLVSVVLLDSDRGGEVKVLRAVSMSERVSRAWRAAVLGTAEQPEGAQGGGGRWTLAPERAGEGS